MHPPVMHPGDDFPLRLYAGGDFEPGAVDDALPHFTSLRTLALDRGTLHAVPRQLSALTGLQVLSLHQALDGAEIDRSSFAVLSCLTALSTLSISGCALHEVPLGVAQLTTLKVRAGWECGKGDGGRGTFCCGDFVAGREPAWGRVVRLVGDHCPLQPAHVHLCDVGKAGLGPPHIRHTMCGSEGCCNSNHNL